MEDMSGFDWMGPIGVAPLKLQLEVLGLDETLLGKLREDRLRVLDIGCGETYELVKYLRAQEINAEGLDPRIKNSKEYLMDMGLPKGFKEKGKILPRPSNHYDLIISHCMDYFYDIIYFPGSKEEIEAIEFDRAMPGRGMIICSNFAILEAIRVLKSRSEMRIYPSICAIGNMKKTLEEMNCSYEQRDLDKERIKYFREKCRGIYSWFEEPRKRGNISCRTVISK